MKRLLACYLATTTIVLGGCSGMPVVNEQTPAPTAVQSQDKSDLKTFAPREKVMITTDLGEYEFTVLEVNLLPAIKGAREPAYQVVWQYTNISFQISGEDSPLGIMSGDLRVRDAEGFVLTPMGAGWANDCIEAKILAQGESCIAKDTFNIVNADSEYVDVSFIRLQEMNAVFRVPISSAPQSPEPVAVAPEKEAYTSFKSGQYKVGVDIPEGEYMLLADSGKGYFSITSDANGDDIIANDNFINNSILTISSGQYLELSRCSAIPLNEAPNIAEGKSELPSGMYKVGLHLQAGEYKLQADEGRKGYYCIYTVSDHDDIVSNDNFEGSRYVAVKNGQYLVMKRCTIKIIQ